MSVSVHTTKAVEVVKLHNAAALCVFAAEDMLSGKSEEVWIPYSVIDNIEDAKADQKCELDIANWFLVKYDIKK